MDLLVFISCFVIIALASRQIGQLLVQAGLPLISGFLFTGVIAGPHVLGLIRPEALESLRFVDEIALGFIAFAAGNELYLKEMQSAWKNIAWITSGLVVSTFCLCTAAFFSLSVFMPFMQEMSTAGRLAVSVVAGSIMVARSPSSAIAIVNELRAKGEFTRTALGVTVIMDVVVITLFAFASSVADGLLSGMAIEIGFIGLLVVELTLAVASGIVLGKLLQLVMHSPFYPSVKTGLVLLAGYSVFHLSDFVHDFSLAHVSISILLEPLLICMVASFYLSNFTGYRKGFSKILNDTGPPVYIAFFTLTGASLALGVLVKVWGITLVLFAVRAGAIFIGSFVGGTIAGAPMKHNRIAWMSYMTQAGVGLGLAKEVIVEFPEWGTPFATIIIATIVLNQIVGPPLFKRAIKKAREAHPKAPSPIIDQGPRDAVIFGLDRQSLALAHMLWDHGWSVRIGAIDLNEEDLPDTRIPIFEIPNLSLGQLKKAKVSKAKAIVAMLSDQENLKICELAYEHFATDTMIVRLNHRENLDPFNELGALVVEPGSAIVSLLDNLVRSPSTASMLLGTGKHQDVFDLAIRNPDLNGLALGNLKIPLDTIVTALHRNGRREMAHNAMRLRVGDVLTVVGSLKSIETLALRFDVDREKALLEIVEKVRAKALSQGPVTGEVKKILHQKPPPSENRLDRVIAQSLVMELDQAMGAEAFFLAASHELSAELETPASSILSLLVQREREISTVLGPSLAVPHIIVQGENRFCLLLARCQKGIYFSESAPAVPAVVVLAGSRDQRALHLKALSAIARSALDPRFENQWRRARNHDALRQLLLQSSDHLPPHRTDDITAPVKTGVG
ncbi:MAG TPA: cation:proton antiporter [Desulfobacteraceae bacterium]|nr:cation:proton antiporter [Desulfobacteraceae bacterium]